MDRLMSPFPGVVRMIRRVASEVTMPVIKHYDGNCHVYVDLAADVEMAANITENSKCQRIASAMHVKVC